MRRRMIEVRGRVREEEYDFFKESFPQHGATQWFVETALKCFNEQIRKDPTLKEPIDKAIFRMLEMARAISQVPTAG